MDRRGDSRHADALVRDVATPAGYPLTRHAHCSTMGKGFSFKVEVFGPKVRPVQVKPLVETITSRLPS